MFSYLVAGVLALSSVGHVAADEDFGQIHHYYNGWNGNQCNHEIDNKKIKGKAFEEIPEQPDAWWCLKMCRKNNKMTGRCKAWNWEKDTQICYLLEKPKRDEDNNSFKSGEICEMYSNPCETSDKTTLLKQMDINEPLIRPCENTSSEQQCAAVCAGVDGCMSSVWNKKSNDCCLRWSTGNGKLFRKKKSFARVRCQPGSKDYEEDPEDNECKPGEKKDNYDYPGNDIDCFRQDAKWCYMRCDLTSGCVGATHENGRCCLKKALVGGVEKTKVRSYTRCESGKPKDPCSQPDKIIYEESMTYNDDDIGQCVAKDSVEECAAECAVTDGCMAGVFNEDGECCLKTASNEPKYEKKSTSFRRCDSGNKPEEEYECKPGNKIEDYDFPGSNIGSCFQYDPHWCFKRCDMTHGCVGATHSGGECCMKSYIGYNDRVEKPGTKTYTRCESGEPKDACKEANKIVFEDDMNYEDGNIGQCVAKGSVQECAAECAVTDGCMVGVLSKDGQCCLKSSPGRPVFARGYKAFRRCDSGSKPQDEGPAECGKRLISYKFDDEELGCSTQKDVHWCDKQCWMAQDKGCVAFSFNPNTRQCCLKKGGNKKVQDSEWISKKLCPCGTKLTDTDYSGKKIKCMAMQDEEWCREKCELMAECKASTFKDGNCCFFSRTKDAKKVPGPTSYKKCFGFKPKEKKDDCPEKVEGQEFPGHTYKSVQQDSFKWCKMECMNDKANGCKYFTFHKQGEWKGECHLKKQKDGMVANEKATSGCIA